MTSTTVTIPLTSRKTVHLLIVDRTESPINYTEDIQVDVTIAILASLLIMVALIGNVPSIIYFWRELNDSNCDLLYFNNSGMDLVASVLRLPVIISLLNTRSAPLSRFPVICTGWYIVLSLLNRISKLVVVLISVLRCIAIVLPFTIKKFKPHSGFIKLGILIYTSILLIIDIAMVVANVVEVRFEKRAASCTLIPDTKREWKERVASIAFQIYWSFVQLLLILPCLIVLISFLVSVIYLSKNGAVRSEDKRKFRRASITIALFTMIFLLCQLPSFMLQVTYLVSVTQTLSFSNNFSRYGYLMSEFFLPLLNSAANPCLYFLRMSKFRMWIEERVKRCCFVRYIRGQITGIGTQDAP